MDFEHMMNNAACAAQSRTLADYEDIREAIKLNVYAPIMAENARLRDGLHALAHPSDASNGVLRSVAYDIVMNGMDGETAKFQIQRRAELEAQDSAPPSPDGGRRQR